MEITTAALIHTDLTVAFKVRAREFSSNQRRSKLTVDVYTRKGVSLVNRLLSYTTCRGAGCSVCIEMGTERAILILGWSKVQAVVVGGKNLSSRS